MADRRNEFPPSVNVGKLYERTSAQGNQYITGFFGSMKLTLLKSKDADAEGNPIWNLVIAAAPPRNGDQGKARKADAERPRDADRGETRARTPMQSQVSARADVEIPF